MKFINQYLKLSKLLFVRRKPLNGHKQFLLSTLSLSVLNLKLKKQVLFNTKNKSLHSIAHNNLLFFYFNYYSTRYCNTTLLLMFFYKNF
ncbi:hypothetical protein EGCR1_03975 [Enterococcus gilvus]|nr:hypothetical protein EGCR1_03975 [Enterococcus gilvus]